MRAHLLVLSPVRDLLMAFVWLHAAFSRKVVWRGNRLRIGPRTRLLPAENELPTRSVRPWKARPRAVRRL